MLIAQLILFAKEAERAGKKTAKCYYLKQNGGIRGYKPETY